MRFWSQNQFSHLPQKVPVRPTIRSRPLGLARTHRTALLPYFGQIKSKSKQSLDYFILYGTPNYGPGQANPFTLYYEHLDLPLEELERLKSLKVREDPALDPRSGLGSGPAGSLSELTLPPSPAAPDLVLQPEGRVRGGACAARAQGLDGGGGARDAQATARACLCRKNIQVWPAASSAVVMMLTPLAPTHARRLMEQMHHRLYKQFDDAAPVHDVNDGYWVLRAEEVPEGEAEQGGRTMQVCHVHENDAAATAPTFFGDPFLLRIRDDETVAQIRARIQVRALGSLGFRCLSQIAHLPWIDPQAKLGVADDEFAKWKLAFHPPRGPLEFLDSDTGALLGPRVAAAAGTVLNDSEVYLALQVRLGVV